MSTYFWIHILTLAGPLAFSFEKKVQFFKMWKYFIPALLIQYFIMIVWDHFFTLWGVWGFNSEHIQGVWVWDLPLEEHLFFLTVPYACLFIYVCLEHYVSFKPPIALTFFIGLVLMALLLWQAYLNYQKLYTAIAFLCAAFLIFQHLLVFRSFKSYLGRFFMAFIISIIPFLIVNGILTSLPVVTYDDNQNLGIRMGTIPVEDLAYHLFDFLLLIGCFEWFKRMYGGKQESSAISEA